MMKIFPCLTLFFAAAFTQTSIAQENWTLQACIAHAQEHNLQIKQQELNHKATEVNLTQSKLGALPSLNGFATHGYGWGQTVDRFTNQFASSRVQSNNFALNSSVTLFQGMRTQNQIQQNKHNLEGAQYDIAKSKNDIGLSIATAYLQILFNQELTKVAEEQRNLTQAQVQRTQKLVDAGALAQSNVLDIKAQLALDETTLINQENALTLARLQLVQLLQLSPEEAKSFKIAVPATPDIADQLNAQAPGTIYEAALNVLPEIKSAEHSIYAAEYGRKMAVGARLPSLSLNASIGTGYSGLARELIDLGAPSSTLIGFTESLENVYAPTFDNAVYGTMPFYDQIDQNFNQSVSLTLNIPLFNGNQVNAQVQQAQIQAERMNLQLEQTKNQVFQNIQQAHADAFAALKKYKATDAALTSIEEAFRFAEVRRNQNSINQVDYQDAKNKLIKAKSDLLQAKYEFIFKSKILDFYQGKPLTL